MKRKDLEHIIRASSSISNDYEIMVVGSQSILGEFPFAPEFLLQSMEADVYPKNLQDKSDLIDGSIGENSQFHATYGYYAQGVSKETAVLAKGWEDRLIAIRISDSVGYCLDVHDLVLSKLVAKREKDIEFVRVVIENNMVSLDKLKLLISSLPKDAKDLERSSRVLNSLNKLWVEVNGEPNKKFKIK